MNVRTWSGRIALLGVETGDARRLAGNATVTFRSNVGFLGWQKTTGGGHAGAIAIGGYTDARVEGDAIVVPPGAGFFLDTPEAREAQEYIERGVMSPSIDPDTVEVHYINGDTGSELADEDFFEALFGLADVRVVEEYTSFTVAGATLVMHSALDGVGIALDPIDESAAAPAVGLVASVLAATTHAPTVGTHTDGDGLPIAVPTPFGFEVADGAWFSEPDLDWPMGVHRVTDGPDRGRVQGYIADREAYHLSSFLRDRSYVRPPVTQTDHYYFRQTAVQLADGGRVAVGKLCVGGGHVTEDGSLDWQSVQRAYDDTATAWAVVASGDSSIGTWVSGYVLGDTDPRVLADGLSSAYSGHWCAVPGHRVPELVAAVGVNVPALATMRTAMSVQAPGTDPDVLSLRSVGVPAERHPLAAKWRQLRMSTTAAARTEQGTTPDLAEAVVDEMERRAEWRTTAPLAASLAERNRAAEAARLRGLVTDIRTRRADA